MTKKKSRILEHFNDQGTLTRKSERVDFWAVNDPNYDGIGLCITLPPGKKMTDMSSIFLSKKDIDAAFKKLKL